MAFNTDMQRPIVEASGISKKFGGVPVLHGIDLSVMPGEIVGLVGENGAGKSTLMNIIAGVIPRTAGTLLIDGEQVELQSIRDGQVRGICVVHQELSSAGELTVAENVFLGRYPTNRLGLVDFKSMNQESRRILDHVGLGDIEPTVRLGSLRSGEQQLAEFAKAMSRKPRLLILDEPTSSLTPAEAGTLFACVHELAVSGVAVIIVTHRLEDALEHCDRLIVLRDGRKVVEIPASGTTRAELIVHMIGRSATSSHRDMSADSEAIRLDVKDLAHETQLDGIEFVARRGEIVGLFGLVGAGRTEFLETLYGCREARCGSVSIDGEPLELGSVTGAAHSGLFMLSESRKTRGILPTHSVCSNITVGALRKFSRFGFVDRRAERSEAEGLIRKLDIRMADMSQPMTTLSGGNQQKALFARALLTNARVLLLDEPTHGVDIGAKAEIHLIINELAADGVTIVFASSELPEILAIADRCVVFAGGRIVTQFDRNEFDEAAILSAAFALAGDQRVRGQLRSHPNG